MIIRRSRWYAGAGALLLSAALPALQAQAAVQPNRSLFAVLKQKGGFASGRTHDHLFTADKYDAEFMLDHGALSRTRFRLAFAVRDLAVDDPGAKQEWQDELKAVGLRAEPFRELSEKQRTKVYESMADEGQLDAATFPRIPAELRSLEEKGAV